MNCKHGLPQSEVCALCDLEKVKAVIDINPKPPHLWTDEEVNWAKKQLQSNPTNSR